MLIIFLLTFNNKAVAFYNYMILSSFNIWNVELVDALILYTWFSPRDPSEALLINELQMNLYCQK